MHVNVIFGSNVSDVKNGWEWGDGQGGGHTLRMFNCMEENYI